MWVRPDGARLHRLLDEVAAGRLHVEVDRVVPLEHTAEAFAASRGGSARGKVVISVSDPALA